MLRGDFYLKQSIPDWKPVGLKPCRYFQISLFSSYGFKVTLLTWTMNLTNLARTVVEAHLLWTCRAWKISPFQHMHHPQPYPAAQNSWVADRWGDRFLLLPSLHLFSFDVFYCFFFSWKTHYRNIVCAHRIQRHHVK